MKVVGLIAAGLGVLIVLLGYGMSGAAEYSDTLNMGLLNDKTNMVLAGGFMAVSGAILFAASQVIAAIRR